LERLGIEAETMPTGCCGMAGSFGFEAGKYGWSVRIAEHALLPSLRAAAPDISIVASGYSCREQIEQLTGRETRHVVEIVAQAMGFPPSLPPPRTPNYGLRTAGAAVGIGAGFALGAWAIRRSRRPGGTRPRGRLHPASRPARATHRADAPPRTVG
jgi:hypothetical protein